MSDPSFWQRLLSPFRRRPQDLVRPDDPQRYYRRFLPYAQAAGVVVTNENALELSVVWGCVTAVVNGIAPSRWNVYTIDAKGQRKNLPDDPLSYLLNCRPNDDMTAIALREVLGFSALTWGNGYAEIGKSLSGKVTALWPLLPNRVQPRRDPETLEMYYDVQQQDGAIVRVPADRMYHLRGPGISGLMGDNLVARATMSMSLAAAQERFASTYFGNNTVIGGVIEHPKKMSPEAHERLKTSWADEHKGPDKAHGAVILEEDAKWHPYEVTAQQAQMVESRKFQIEEICRWYGVPPHKVQHLDRATFNNIEHLAIEFVRDALTPWAVRLEQEADFKLVPTRGLHRQTKLDTGWLTHGDFKSRMEGYQIARQTGLYSINQVLHREGENTIGPLGDTRMVMANMQTLEQLEAGVFAPKPGGGGGDAGGNTAAGDGTDTGTGGGDDTTGGGDGVGGAPTSHADVATDALVLLFSSTLERYDARLEAREKDLRRGGASDKKVAQHLAEERVKLRPWVVEQAQAAMSLAGADQMTLLLAVDAIDNGLAPRAAAQRIVATGKKAA